MIKRWLKKMNEPVSFDPLPQSRGQWVFVIIVLVLFVVLSVWADAHAQPELNPNKEKELGHCHGPIENCPSSFGGPELKVGQEMEYFKKGFSQKCKVTEIHKGWFMCWPLDRPHARNGWSVTISTLYGYRILKLAPRPEFKLPSAGRDCIGPEIDVDCVIGEEPDDLGAIADELRYLRKEIEAIKK